MLRAGPASTLRRVILPLLRPAVVTAMTYGFVRAMTAVSASENATHLYFGIRAAQGAPTHLAVGGAGLIGVILGALLATHYRRTNGLGKAPAGSGEPRRDEVDVDRQAVHSEQLPLSAGC